MIKKLIYLFVFLVSINVAFVTTITSDIGDFKVTCLNSFNISHCGK